MSVNKVNIDGSLTTIADLIQVAALPTAGADYLGKIYQYIGATSDPLVNGYFYKCISDGEQSPTYSWENVTLGQIIQVETMPTATADNSGAIVQYVGATDANYINGYFYKCVSDGGVTPAYSWEKIQVSDGGDTIQVDELPTASADELGNIYEFVGTTTANYINGRFYRCISDGASTPTYSWEEVDFGDGTPHWSGTRAEYEAIKNTLEAGTYVSITDDYDDGLEVVDVIENGNMNAVTSNAVYDALATTSVSIEKTTIAGLTTSWGDNAPASHIAYRVGNLVVMNVNLSITGTYSGTTGWVDLWNMPNSLIKTGETLHVPYMVNIGRNISGNVLTVLNGVAIYIENGQSLTIGVTGQIVCPISS